VHAGEEDHARTTSRRGQDSPCKRKNFVYALPIGHMKSLVITDCPLSGRGQSRVSNFYLLNLDNFATTSRRCIGVINKLVGGQHVDYTCDYRARRG